jgi:hypothetical protein
MTAEIAGVTAPGIDCASCHRAIALTETYSLTSDRRAICDECAVSVVAPTIEDPVVLAAAGRPSTIVRTYPGNDQVQAAGLLEAEARRFAPLGYRLRSQTWAASERPFVVGVFGAGAVLIGLFLLLLVEGGFLLGLVVGFVGVAVLAVYAGNTRQAGLTATFEAGGDADAQAHPGAPAGGQARSAAERLRELQSLRAEGLITEDELATRRAAIIGSI